MHRVSALLHRSLNKRYPVANRGEGVYLEDASGKLYIDFSGSAAVNFIGHGPGFWASISAKIPPGGLGAYPEGPVAPLVEQVDELSAVTRLEVEGRVRHGSYRRQVGIDSGTDQGCSRLRLGGRLRGSSLRCRPSGGCLSRGRCHWRR